MDFVSERKDSPIGDFGDSIPTRSTHPPPVHFLNLSQGPQTPKRRYGYDELLQPLGLEPECDQILCAKSSGPCRSCTRP